MASTHNDPVASNKETLIHLALLAASPVLLSSLAFSIEAEKYEK